MDEYISREYVLDKFIEGDGNDEFTEGYNFAVNEYREKIKGVPFADVQLVRHGYWYHNTSKYISELDACFIQACCSCCGRYSDKIDLYSEIMSNECCSHCGAIMDGDAE